MIEAAVRNRREVKLLKASFPSPYYDVESKLFLPGDLNLHAEHFATKPTKPEQEETKEI